MEEGNKFNGFKPRLDMKGFTSIPNEFFDEALPNIKSLSELKVLLALFRKTYGWVSHIDQDTGAPVYKEEDAVSLSQFEKLTGLSRPACSDGVKRAMDDGYVVCTKKGSFGGYTRENHTSVYMVAQEGMTPPPPPEPKQKPNQEPIPEPPQEKKTEAEPDMSFTDDTERLKNIKVVMPSDKPNEVAEEDIPNVLDELYAPEEKPTKKDKRGKGFQDLPRSKWNANHLVAYFRHMYKLELGITSPASTNKDRGQCKNLLTAYEPEQVADAIDFYLQNYKQLTYLPEGYPNFGVFFAYRNTIIPQMLNPSAAKQKKSSAREYKPEVKKNDGNDGTGNFNWE